MECHAPDGPNNSFLGSARTLVCCGWRLANDFFNLNKTFRRGAEMSTQGPSRTGVCVQLPRPESQRAQTTNRFELENFAQQALAQSAMI